MSSARSNSVRVWRGTKGITSLEFALVLLPFMLLLLGTFDLGRYFLTVNSVAAFANAVARYCSINPAFLTETNSLITAAFSDNLANYAPFLDQTKVTLTGQCQLAPLPVPAEEKATVTVTYPFTPITPGLDLLNTTITQTVTFYY